MNYININLTSTFFEFSNFANTINAEMDIYLIMVIALGLLAIGDLVVGVSNDAVNFLNSAWALESAFCFLKHPHLGCPMGFDI